MLRRASLCLTLFAVVSCQGGDTLNPIARSPSLPSVLFLINSREAASINLGASGAVIVTHSPSFGTATTGECGGTSAEYPVQGVLVITATHTYVTSVVICRPDPLDLGQRVRLAPAPRSDLSADYSRFTGATP